MVATDDVRRRPELLKVLFRGTRLDLELYDRIAGKNFPTLRDYWEGRFGGFRGRPKYTGNGYQRLRKSSRFRSGNQLPGESAAYLHNIPEVPNSPHLGMLLDPAEFPLFGLSRVHHGRSRDLYRGPILLIREAPPVSHGRIMTSVALSDVVFNQSYHGYTAATHEEGADLVRYLALVIGSKIALWHALITSGRFGFEREVVEKFIIDEIPIPVFEQLAAEDRETSSSLFASVAEDGSEASWDEVDRWVGSLYGLTPDDVETMGDTLRYRLPFSANLRASQAPVSDGHHATFNRQLSAELKPWGDRFDHPLAISMVRMPPISPWHFVLLQGRETGLLDVEVDWTGPIELADKLSATEVIYVDAQANRLVLGRLNQARYWTASQARLAARRIIWDHVDFLAGKCAE